MDTAYLYAAIPCLVFALITSGWLTIKLRPSKRVKLDELIIDYMKSYHDE